MPLSQQEKDRIDAYAQELIDRAGADTLSQVQRDRIRQAVASYRAACERAVGG